MFWYVNIRHIYTRASLKGGKNNGNFYTPHSTTNIEEKFAILYKTNLHAKAVLNVLVKVYINK